MVKTEKKYNNPKETICLMTYTNSIAIEEISNTLYGTRNTRVNQYVKKLVKMGWMKIKKDYKKDGRFYYCSSTYRCFLDDIVTTLKNKNIILSSEKKKKIRTYLNSDGFKEYIRVIVEDPDFLKKSCDFSLVRYELAMYSIFRSCISEYLYDNFTVDNVRVDTTSSQFKKMMSKNIDEHRKKLLDFEKLGEEIWGDLAHLMDNPLNIQLYHTVKDTIEFIKYTEGLYYNKKNVREVNGNGHGLL